MLLTFQKHYLKLFTFIVMFTLSANISAQSSTSDFWKCFEKITTISELQEKYPNTPAGETTTLNLMKHGIEIPSLENVSFESNIAINLLEKSAILGQNISEFFIIHEAKYQLDQAYFEVVFYYNFSGNYLHFKTAKINLTKNNGNWSITNSIVE